MFGLLEGFHTSPLMLTKAKGRCENVVLLCATLPFSKGLVLEISTCNFLTIHEFGAISLCQAVPWNMQKAVKGSGYTGEAGFQGAFYWLNIFNPFGCQHAMWNANGGLNVFLPSRQSSTWGCCMTQDEFRMV